MIIRLGETKQSQKTNWTLVKFRNWSHSLSIIVGGINKNIPQRFLLAEVTSIFYFSLQKAYVMSLERHAYVLQTIQKPKSMGEETWNMFMHQPHDSMISLKHICGAFHIAVPVLMTHLSYIHMRIVSKP